MNWNADYKELIPFLGEIIYRPENVLVKLCANSNDADASTVEISTKGESRQILIKDDGCGMDSDDLDELDELITIAKSKKRQMTENDVPFSSVELVFLQHLCIEDRFHRAAVIVFAVL